MDFRRLFDIFPYQQAIYPQKTALAYRNGLEWKKYATEECLLQINKVSAGLYDLGLVRNDKVALMFDQGNPYWNFLDFGMQQIGVIVVPIHAAVGEKELEFILKDSEAKCCITSSKELYEKVEKVVDNILNFKKIFCLEPIANVPGWEALTAEPTEKHLETFQGLKAAIQEDDLATIIYTSGSSGIPKGVMLSHKNIVSNIKATISLVPINCDKRVISFLPLSHIFERMVIYSYIAAGASVYYLDKPANLLAVAKEIRPHYFTSVPRFLEKFYAGILERANKMNRLKRTILLWAIALGERYNGKKKMLPLYFLQLKIADLLVYRSWRIALGNKVEGVVVGAAALQPRLGKLFSAAGIEIREGYGLTETSPVISFNRFEPGGVHFGTVGIPIPGIQLKIDHPNEEGEGEILVKGPGVMLGYFNKPELTAEVLDENGWFRTGDIGKMVHKRFLEITDRKKDIFKTTTGKFISPQTIENLLNDSPFIEQSMIVGFNRPYVAALIVPVFSRLKKWCEENKVHWTSEQYMVINPKVVRLFEQLIESINEGLTKQEKIRKFTLLYEDWSVENGEITPTLKLRRPYLLEKHQAEIDEMYKNN